MISGLIFDLFPIYPFCRRRAIERKQFPRVVVSARISRSKLQVDLRTKKTRMVNVFVRELIILVSVCVLLSGCADTSQAPQADSDSVLRKPDSDREVHGEVGVMYGHTAR